MRDADIEKRIFYFCSSMFAAGSDAGTDGSDGRCYGGILDPSAVNQRLRSEHNHEAVSGQENEALLK